MASEAERASIDLLRQLRQVQSERDWLADHREKVEAELKRRMVEG
jgi:hypothetical protein